MAKKENKQSKKEISDLQNRLSFLEKIAAKYQRTEETLKKTRQDLHVRNTVLEAINAVADNIYRSLDYRSLAKEAIAAMVKYGKTATVTMFEYNEDENCLIQIDASLPFEKAHSRVLTERLYLDKSVAGQAVREKKIILCKDIATDPRILPNTKEALLKEGRKSAVFIPLLFQNRVLGTINLVFTKKVSFKDYELETLLSIGKTIGMAMANVKNIEKIKVETKERLLASKVLHKTELSLSESQQNVKISNEALRIINAVADKIYLALDYDTLGKEAIEIIKLYGRTSAIIMFECNEDENTITFLASSSDLEKSKDATIKLTSTLLPKSLTAQTIREKRIIICEDALSDQRINPEIKKWIKQYNMKSVVSVPLLFRDKTIGVINLFFAEKYNLTEYELQTLLSIGKTIGLAMANAKNIEKSKSEIAERKKAHESMARSITSLQAVNTVADRVYGALDYDTLNKEAMSAMAIYGRTSIVNIYEYDEESDMISLIGISLPEAAESDAVRLGRKLSAKESMGGTAIHENNIIVCTNIPEERRIRPDIREALIKDGRKVIISIPLLFQKRAMGVMNLFFNEAVSLNDYQIDTLSSVGKTIGLAMANVRHIQQIKAEVAEREKAQEAMAHSIASLQTVNTVADKIYRSLDYDTLTDEALTAISRYGKAVAASFYEYEEDSDSLLYLKSLGVPYDPRTFIVNDRIPTEKSFTGQAIRQKQIVICEDIAADDRIVPTLKEAILKVGRKSAVSIPLLFGDKALGAINLLFSEKLDFADYELETLFSIGKTIGLAMANVRHVEEIKAEITERKKTQEALSQSEEKYRLLIENAGDAIFIGLKGFIVYANPHALALLGYTMEELAPKPIAAFLIRETDKGQKMKSSIKSAYGIESFKLINKRNEELSLEVHIVDIVWENKEASLYFGRDVTGQEKMEAQLYQAQKMEAIGTLAGGLAHDFNNLLMGIEGNTSLMLLHTLVNHPHYDRLKNIEHYVTSGAEITSQLLGFARGGKYEVKPININNLIEKSASLFARTKKEITIHENFAKDIWSVEVDRGQMEQVLLNLFVNAWQAMPGGGNLYLLTANKKMDENMAGIHGIKPGRYVKISVTDDGIGMDEETQRRLFDPFFTTKERGRGTGLGLPSAYGIIKNHGGVITVYSEKGSGTTFNLYLPASGKEVAEDIVDEDTMFAGKETILFVDDEEMIIDVGKDMLESMGYTVVTAGSGKAALEIYAQRMKDIDLVILDLIMPEMGGEATFGKLKEINPAIKVLLSSGYSINGLADKLLTLGCRGFIQKPYSIKELSARIRETLDTK